MADKSFKTDVSKVVKDFNKSLAAAEKTLAQATSLGKTKIAKEATGLINQLKDIAPMLEVLKRAAASGATATDAYTGPITQAAADQINANLSNAQYAGSTGGGPGRTVYAREADVAGYSGYSPDNYYIKEKGTGISNTGKRYIAGKLATDKDWSNFLSGVTGVTSGGTVGAEPGTVASGAGTETGTGSTGVGADFGAETFDFGGRFTGFTKRASTQEEVDTLAKQYADAQTAMEQEQQRQSIINVLSDRFARYNLSSLIPTIKKLAQEGANESTITLALQETEDYKKRFKANEDRQKKDLQVLSPAEYLNVEDRYRQVLRAYGLDQFNNDSYVAQFIANDVSVAELTDRINTAVKKVQQSDPAVVSTLRKFYNVTDNDLVAYVLDPGQQFPKITQQFVVAGIGSAARAQGIRSNVDIAEQLARQGVTETQAQQGYATIASLLPAAEKLSEIYGTELGAYTLTEAEQEVFSSLASAQRKRQQLAQKEISTFTGSSGVGRTALSSKSSGGAF